MLAHGPVETTLHTSGRPVLQVVLSKVRLCIRDAPARNIVLVIELVGVRGCAVLLVLMMALAVVLVGGIVLERFA